MDNTWGICGKLKLKQVGLQKFTDWLRCHTQKHSCLILLHVPLAVLHTWQLLSSAALHTCTSSPLCLSSFLHTWSALSVFSFWSYKCHKSFIFCVSLLVKVTVTVLWTFLNPGQEVIRANTSHAHTHTNHTLLIISLHPIESFRCRCGWWVYNLTKSNSIITCHMWRPLKVLLYFPPLRLSCLSCTLPNFHDITCPQTLWFLSLPPWSTRDCVHL